MFQKSLFMWGFYSYVKWEYKISKGTVFKGEKPYFKILIEFKRGRNRKSQRFFPGFRKNVLMILCDEWRWQTKRCYTKNNARCVHYLIFFGKWKENLNSDISCVKKNLTTNSIQVTNLSSDFYQRETRWRWKFEIPFVISRLQKLTNHKREL